MSSEKKSSKSTVWKYFEVSKKDIRFCICPTMQSNTF